MWGDDASPYHQSQRLRAVLGSTGLSLLQSVDTSPRVSIVLLNQVQPLRRPWPTGTTPGALRRLRYCSIGTLHPQELKDDPVAGSGIDETPTPLILDNRIR